MQGIPQRELAADFEDEGITSLKMQVAGKGTGTHVIQAKRAEFSQQREYDLEEDFSPGAPDKNEVLLTP